MNSNSFFYDPNATESMFPSTWGQVVPAMGGAQTAQSGGDAAAQAYLARYPDIAADPYWGAHPQEHFQTYGQREGRTYGEQAAPQAAAAPVAAPAAQTPNAMYGNTPDAWSAFTTQARAEDTGRNNMSGVMSDYASISADPATARQQAYYQTPAQSQSQMSEILKGLLGSVVK